MSLARRNDEAGFYLRALGRLVEAVEPLDASLQNYIEDQNWQFAAIIVSNLSELRSTFGMRS